MAAPCRQTVYRILRRHLHKQQNLYDKIFNRRISFSNISITKGSYGVQKLKNIKVLAGVLGVSSVFVAKSVWNSVTAETFVSEQPGNNGIADSRDIKLTLYQFQSCPFCCKVRAVLDYYGFPYKVVEVNSVTKKQLKFSEYKKVPVLVYEGENGEDFVPMTDSSVIMSMLISHLVDPSVDFATLKTYYPALEEKIKRKKILEFPNKYFIMYGDQISDARTEKQRKEERKWRAWVDDHLVHMISPNVYRTPSESLEAFHHFSEWGQWDKNFSTLNRLLVIYVGTPVMYIIGKIIKKKYNLNDDVRVSLYQACDDWMKALGKRKYLGGDEPCIADLVALLGTTMQPSLFLQAPVNRGAQIAVIDLKFHLHRIGFPDKSVYGVLSSFEGCQAFKDLMDNSKIKNWYYKIQQDIQDHKGASVPKASVK